MYAKKTVEELVELMHTWRTVIGDERPDAIRAAAVLVMREPGEYFPKPAHMIAKLAIVKETQWRELEIRRSKERPALEAPSQPIDWDEVAEIRAKLLPGARAYFDAVLSGQEESSKKVSGLRSTRATIEE